MVFVHLAWAKQHGKKSAGGARSGVKDNGAWPGTGGCRRGWSDPHVGSPFWWSRSLAASVVEVHASDAHGGASMEERGRMLERREPKQVKREER